MLTTPTCNEKNTLLIEIESLQKELIQIGMKEGFTSENTIAISQKLDQYIVDFQKIK